jgi:hypothetical protein
MRKKAAYCFFSFWCEEDEDEEDDWENMGRWC